MFSVGCSVVELQTPKMMAVVAMEHGGPRGIPKDQGRIYGNLYLSHFVNCVECLDDTKALIQWTLIELEAN